MTTERKQEQKELITENIDYKEIINSLEKHEIHRSECLNFIASENTMSPATRLMLSSDLGNRYSVGPWARWFPGLDNFTEIENKAVSLTKDLLKGAEYVNVQPLSGMSANQVAYRAILNRGDRVLVVSERHGGHFSHRKGSFDLEHGVPVGKRAKSLLEEYGALVDYLPFDENVYDINISKAEQKIVEYNPKLIIVGTSEMLFPAPVRELRKIINSNGLETQILYDAAHVFGLILGDKFQQPLLEGADMLSTSTNKTMGGPDHGLVAWTKEAELKYGYRSISHNESDCDDIGHVGESLVPFYTSNNHTHHIAGVAVTLAELKAYGGEYAQQVINNARALAQELTTRGIKVLGDPQRGYTQSHEVLIDIEEATRNPNKKEAERLGEEAKLKLAGANIITSKCPIPYAYNMDDTGCPNTGIRIGTNEMTRMGMCEYEMVLAARLIADVLQNKKTPEEVRNIVVKFRECYQEQKYCFPVDGRVLERINKLK